MQDTKYINRDKLYEIYPHIAIVLDTVYENNKHNNYWFFVNYFGKYRGKNGKPRTVSMSAVIDVLEQNGYDVQLVATPKYKDLINQP
jgi:hypothetical protein